MGKIMGLEVPKIPCREGVPTRSSFTAGVYYEKNGRKLPSNNLSDTRREILSGNFSKIIGRKESSEE